MSVQYLHYVFQAQFKTCMDPKNHMEDLEVDSVCTISSQFCSQQQTGVKYQLKLKHAHCKQQTFSEQTNVFPMLKHHQASFISKTEGVGSRLGED